MSVVGQFGSRSGECTSPRGGIKPPLHQTDPLPRCHQGWRTPRDGL